MKNRYFADGKFKKALPRYYNIKLFGSGSSAISQLKAEDRRDAMAKTWYDSVARIKEEFQRNSVNLDPELELISRRVNSSDLFLNSLRQQKKMKNKLL